MRKGYGIFHIFKGVHVQKKLKNHSINDPKIKGGERNVIKDQMSMEPKRDKGAKTGRTVGGRLLAS